MSLDPLWTPEQVPDLTGRTFIVTGANSGLGLATTRQLARHGGHVIMAMRSEVKGKQAVTAITDSWPAASLEVRHLDLADLDSVRAFAAGVHASGLAVDVLVNNAGVSTMPRALSPQGHELQFATNYLGHFALTCLLLDVLEGRSDPRVVTVTSNQHRGSQIYFDDLTGAHAYGPLKFYRQSKFADVVFALELDRRLRAAGSPVRSLLAHPGYTATNLQTNGPTGLWRLVGIVSGRLVGQNVERGAVPLLYAATAPGVESGQMFGPDGFRGLRGQHPKLDETDPATQVPETVARLWQLSEGWTGVGYPATSP